MRQEQIRRIEYYEAILDQAQQMLREGKKPEDDPWLAEKIRELDAYYGSVKWKEDFEADEAGLLPPDLKRGVLSEDGIYNVLQEISMTDYDLIIKQMGALAEMSRDCTAVMANVSALLFEALDNVNWAGFYLVRDGALIVGPFQGKVACVRIERGHGVCGTAWDQDCVQRVPDVHDFPGHIACDSASRSEIVVPFHRDGEVFAVLDIDSPILERFGRADEAGLVSLVRAMEKIVD